jgi:hypothetical protein
VQWIRFGGRPQRHAQPHEGAAALARRNPGAAAGLLEEPADHEQPDAVAAWGLDGGPAVGHHHLDLAGRRAGADVDLDPVGAAAGGRVVDQVLDRLAQHCRAGLDLGRLAGLDAHAGPPGHGNRPGRGPHRLGHVGPSLGRRLGAVA